MSPADGEESSALLRRLPGTHSLHLVLEEAHMLTPAVRRLRFSGPAIATLTVRPGQDLMFAVPADGRAHFRRRYTMRRFLPQDRAVEVDIVLHGDGPGARWAAAIVPGDRVEAIGPRGKIFLAERVAWHLFCGDESALPAISAMVEGLGPDQRAVVVLEVAGPEEELGPVSGPGTVELHWRHRTSEPGTGDVLARALEEISIPEGAGHAYLFGELRQIAAARAVLIERAVAASDIDHKAYWRRGVANAAHGEPERPETTGATGVR